MKSKTVVDSQHLRQGIYVPESMEEVLSMVKEAEDKATDVIKQLGRFTHEELSKPELTDRDRVVMSFAQIAAMAAYAGVNLSFQALPIQKVLQRLIEIHTNALRQFFFDGGARDADVLMEKHGQELMGEDK